MSIISFTSKKQRSERVSLVTAYDYTSAAWAVAAGVDAILIGDSLGNVIQGQDTTLGVTVDQMIYHTKLVRRAVDLKSPDVKSRPLVISDLPFPIGHTGVNEAVRDAARIVKEGGCSAVKFEGSAEDAPIIAAFVRAGIPTMGHIGLRPQQILNLGKYTMQKAVDQLRTDAEAVVNAGAFAVLLECVEPEIAQMVTELVPIPTIGIGSGPYCDGQILVIHDVLGLDPTFVPKHAKQYAHLGAEAIDALKQYCLEVQSQQFPEVK